MKADLIGTMELEVVWPHMKGLADASTGVVEEEDQSVVAYASAFSAIHSPEQEVQLFRLEVAENGLTGLLERQREDALALAGQAGIVPDDVLDEAADRRQTAVASRRAVSPIGFQVVEELDDASGCEIVKSQIGDSAAGGVAEEGKEQTEGIAIGQDGMPASAAPTLEMLSEEGLDQTEHRVCRVSLHVSNPR
jgi:hypothetical protein